MRPPSASTTCRLGWRVSSAMRLTFGRSRAYQATTRPRIRMTQMPAAALQPSSRPQRNRLLLAAGRPAVRPVVRAPRDLPEAGLPLVAGRRVVAAGRACRASAAVFSPCARGPPRARGLLLRDDALRLGGRGGAAMG